MEEKETVQAAKQTANLLRLKKDFYRFSDGVYNMLLTVYGEEQGESIYESEYESLLRELDIKLDNRLMDRINNELSKLENMESDIINI